MVLPQKSGAHIIILGADVRRLAKLWKVGDMAPCGDLEASDPTRLDIPEALADTLDFIAEMKVAWDKLEPGMQRSMCYWVGSAKTFAT